MSSRRARFGAIDRRPFERAGAALVRAAFLPAMLPIARNEVADGRRDHGGDDDGIDPGSHGLSEHAPELKAEDRADPGEHGHVDKGEDGPTGARFLLDDC